MYVAHKYGYQNVKQSLLNISEFVDVLDLSADTVVKMLTSEWKDYEDATQNETAINAMADCIVTRNKKDYQNSPLQIYSAKEFLDTCI